MKTGLGLGLCRGGGSGGGTSSLTFYASLPDFAGTTTLTGITPQVGSASDFTINGAPALNGFGFAMTEATGFTNNVTLNSIQAAAAGSHVSLLIRKNATADTQGIFLGKQADASVFIGAAETGSGSTATSQNASFGTIRFAKASGTTVVAGPSTRGVLWSNSMASSEYVVVTMLDVIYDTPVPAVICAYASFASFICEVDVAGMATFTDSTQSAAIEERLLGDVA